MQEWFGLARNPYDKLGHFVQGFVPALIAREILLRGAFVRGARMTAFLCVCVALAISAVYELIEWWAALALGQGADEFLGTQGDQWDTQSDMFLALIGATVATRDFVARPRSPVAGAGHESRRMASLQPRNSRLRYNVIRRSAGTFVG